MTLAYRLHRVTSQDGLSLAVREYPGPSGYHGPTLLCLGGLTRNAQDFEGLANYHSRTRRVICPDMRGRGLSDYDPEWRSYHAATYVTDVKDILCALGVHEVVLIGTSLGGIMSMAMSAAMPTVIRAMVLNDIGPEVSRKSLERVFDYIGTPPRLGIMGRRRRASSRRILRPDSGRQ